MTRIVSGMLCAALLTLPSVRADAPAGQVDFGTFEPSKSRGEFVEVNLQGSLLSMAAKLAGKDDPEVGKLVESLKSIRVNVVGVGDDNRAEVAQRILSLRGKLDSGGWEKVVNVQDKGSKVTVHVKVRGTESVEGVVVLVEDGGKEAVLVNVVGDVKPEQLEKIGTKLNIEPLKQAAEAIAKEKK